MRRMFSALLTAATLATPFALPATASAAERASASVTIRVFDPHRRDYRRWNRREERESRAELAERHRAYLRYERQRLAERRAYWRWRHEREERFERR
jgi:Ni/Co efflux regulator RcnB